MVSRSRLVQYGALGLFVVGVVILGVGSAGTATPLIIAGVILIVVSSGLGIVATMENQTPSALTSRRFVDTKPAEAAQVVVAV
jgi:hypothetical protein